jgi:DNA-binding transcriptional regulator PaaX
MVRRALERLMKRGVIVRGEFGDSRFDRTSWYTFTQFGRLLMQESEDENCE